MQAFNTLQFTGLVLGRFLRTLPAFIFSHQVLKRTSALPELSGVLWDGVGDMDLGDGGLSIGMRQMLVISIPRRLYVGEALLYSGDDPSNLLSLNSVHPLFLFWSEVFCISNSSLTFQRDLGFGDVD